MKRLFLLLTIACMAMGANAQLIKEEIKPWNKPVDEKYLAGAVPTVDGKVVFTRTFTLSENSTKQADLVFKEAKAWIGNQLNVNEDMISRKAVSVDSVKHEFTLHVEQWLIFTDKALSLDRTRIYYKLDYKINGNQVTMTVSDIHYLYEEERTPTRLTAENQITDKISIKKNGKTFYPFFGKFRVRTIQMVDKLEEGFKNASKL